MYSGVIVESGRTRDVVARPFHPYTLGLKNSMPVLGADKEPISIPGSPPDPLIELGGCRFARRCPFAIDICEAVAPDLSPVEDGHAAACHRADEAPLLRAQAERIETWSRNVSG